MIPRLRLLVRLASSFQKKECGTRQNALFSLQNQIALGLDEFGGSVPMEGKTKERRVQIIRPTPCRLHAVYTPSSGFRNVVLDNEIVAALRAGSSGKNDCVHRRAESDSCGNVGQANLTLFLIVCVTCEFPKRRAEYVFLWHSFRDSYRMPAQNLLWKAALLFAQDFEGRLFLSFSTSTRRGDEVRSTKAHHNNLSAHRNRSIHLTG